MCKYKLEWFNEFVWYLRLFLKVCAFFVTEKPNKKWPTTIYVWIPTDVCCEFCQDIEKYIKCWYACMHQTQCRAHSIDYTMCTASVNKGFGFDFDFGFRSSNVLYFFVYNVSHFTGSNTPHTILHKFFNITQVMIYLIHIYIIRSEKTKICRKRERKKEEKCIFFTVVVVVVCHFLLFMMRT